MDTMNWIFVSSLVWRLGAEHGASVCGDATNVASWQLMLVWRLPEVWLAPSVLRCHPISLVPVPLQPQLWAELAQGARPEVSSLHFWLSHLAGSWPLWTSVGQMSLLKMAWKRGMAGPASCSCKLLSKPCLDWEGNQGKCFQEMPELDCVLCLLLKLRESNQSGVIEFEILPLVFPLVEGFCSRTFKLNFYLIFLQRESKRSVIVHSVSPVKLVSS